MPIVLKFGSPKILEPSGPVQACSGIALPSIHNLSKCNYSIEIVFRGINYLAVSSGNTIFLLGLRIQIESSCSLVGGC